MDAAVKPNGDKINEYIISYVDDLIFKGLDQKGFMEALGQRFTLKPESIKEPCIYLGGVDIKHPKFRRDRKSEMGIRVDIVREEEGNCRPRERA